MLLALPRTWSRRLRKAARKTSLPDGVAVKPRTLRVDGRREVAGTAPEHVAARRLEAVLSHIAWTSMLWCPNSTRAFASPCLSSASTSRTGRDLPPASTCAAVERHCDLGALPARRGGIACALASCGQAQALRRCRFHGERGRDGRRGCRHATSDPAGHGASMMAGPGTVSSVATPGSAPPPSPSAPSGRATCASAATGPPGEALVGSVPVSRLDPDRFRAVPDHGALDGGYRGRDDPELQLGLVHRPDSVPNRRPPSHDDRPHANPAWAPSRSSPRGWPGSAAARPDGSGRRRRPPPARPAAATRRSSRCRWPCGRTG